jgi:hypothetical protein
MYQQNFEMKEVVNPALLGVKKRRGGSGFKRQISELKSEISPANKNPGTGKGSARAPVGDFNLKPN